MSLIDNYPARLTSGYYRVRETWEDAASQLGAYRLLSNAMAKADENPGYFVFSNEGEAIYPEPESGIEDETDEEETGKAETGQPIDEKQDEASESVSRGDDTENGAVADDTTEPETPTTILDETDESTDSTGDSDMNPDTKPEPSNADEFPDAVEYENDGNESPIGYAKLKTLMNIRGGNSLEADSITTYRKDTIVEILQMCGNGWLRIRCPESGTGFAYVNGAEEYICGIGTALYTVSAKDNLWLIAENQLGDGTRYTEIRQLNGLTCNVIRVGMALVLPEKYSN